MLIHIDHKMMGRGIHPWLDSHHHFSFADYYDPKNMHFGILRVFNDDLIKPNSGFPMHPHDNMEIVSYILDGEITHEDSMGNSHVSKRGDMQYMSAGSGLRHAEYNKGSEVLRLAQIWVLPNKRNHEPLYGEAQFKLEERLNKWLQIAGPESSAVNLFADVRIYVAELDENASLEFDVHANRQAYLTLFEGAINVNDVDMVERDALKIIEENIVIKASKKSHMMIIEMAKE